MTASRAALAPTRRPSPRAVVLAILVVAFLGMFVVAGSQFANPTRPEPQRALTLPMPTEPGTTLVPVAGGGYFWLTLDRAGALYAVRASHFIPPAAVSEDLRRSYGACIADGYFRGVDLYTPNGAPLRGSPRLTRYAAEVVDGQVRVNLAHGFLATGPRCAD